MAYAPTVNDRSGEILAQANLQQNALRFAQQQQMWEAVGEGINTIGEGLGEYYKKAADNKMTSEYLDGMAGQMASTNKPDGTPFMSAEQLAKFYSGSTSQKQGMLVPLQAQHDHMLKMNFLNQQINGFGQRQQMQNQVPANQVPMSPQGATPAQAAPFQFGQGVKASPQF